MNKRNIGVLLSLKFLIVSDDVHISKCYSTKPHRNVWQFLKDRAHVYNYCACFTDFFKIYIPLKMSIYT